MDECLNGFFWLHVQFVYVCLVDWLDRGVNNKSIFISLTFYDYLLLLVISAGNSFNQSEAIKVINEEAKEKKVLQINSKGKETHYKMEGE